MEVENREDYSIVGDECKKNQHFVLASKTFIVGSRRILAF